MKICPNCKNESSDEIKFCGNCGFSMAEIEVINQTANIIEEHAQSFRNEKKTTIIGNPFARKCIIFGGIGVACIIVLIIIISTFVGKSSKNENNYVMYTKDEEVFFNGLKKDTKSWQVTTKLMDYDNYSDTTLKSLTHMMDDSYYLSEDGKYIFFADKLDSTPDYGYYYDFNLYYKETDKKDAEAVKIDSGIISYCVNDKATLVTYIKDNNLYQYSVEDDSKEKIDNDVTDWYVSDNGKIIVYKDNENNLYRIESGEDKEKLASDIFTVEYVTKDFKTVYYIKEESLYMQEIGEDKVKIDSDVRQVIKIYETGEIYYVTDGEESLSLMDYVIDDKLAEDNKITGYPSADYPVYPTKPSRWDYDSNEEYTDAYYEWQDRVDEYNEEYERVDSQFRAEVKVYKEKVKRDELREALKGRKLSYTAFSLYYFDGNESKMITDSYSYDYNFENGDQLVVVEGKPVIAYKAYNMSDIGKHKLSDICGFSVDSSVSDFAEMIKLAVGTDRYIAVKDLATNIECEKYIEKIRINASGTLAYYFDNVSSSESYGDLYQISINKGVIGEAKLYDSDVYLYGCEFADDSRIMYLKDYSNYGGDLYIDKELIDYEVNHNLIQVQSDKVVYITDYSSEKQYGTLKIYKKKETEKIDDDVTDFYITPDGRVVYLNDYSTKYYKGTLYVWENGDKKKIDDDVTGFIEIKDLKYRKFIY